MAIQDYFGGFPVAYNPDTGELVRDATFQVFAADDLAFTSPLAVTDPASGVPLTELRSNSDGVLRDFRVAGDLPQVIIRSGGFATRMTSMFGVLKEARFDPDKVDAAIAAATTAGEAQVAASAARVAAEEAAASATAALDSIPEGLDTEDGAIAALVVAPSSQVRAAIAGGFTAKPASAPASARPNLYVVENGVVNWTAVEQAVGRALGWIFVTDPQYGADPSGAVDSTSAVTGALEAAALLPQGRRVIYFPAGSYLISAPLVSAATDIQLLGESASDENGLTGSALVAASGFSGNLLTLTGQRPRIEGLSFRGGGFVTRALVVSGFGARIRGVYAHGATEYALHMTGNRSTLSTNYWRGQAGAPAAAYIAGADIQIEGDRFRADGALLAFDSGMSGGSVKGGHMTGSANTVSLLRLRNSNNLLEGVYFDTCLNGPMIHIGHTAAISGNRFIGCYYFNDNTGLLDNTHPAILIDSSIATVKATVVLGGYFSASFSNRFSFAIQTLGSSVYGTVFTASMVRWAVSLWNVRPAVVGDLGHIIESAGNAARTARTAGVATFSGNGSQTVFQITGTLLATAPGHGARNVSVTPGSAAAAAPCYAVHDAANDRITVTFLTAPAAGSNNVVLNWQASI